MASVWSITEAGEAVADDSHTQDRYILKALKQAGQPLRRQELVKAIEAIGCRSDGDLANNMSNHLTHLKNQGLVKKEQAESKRKKKPAVVAKPLPPQLPNFTGLSIRAAVGAALDKLGTASAPADVAEFVTRHGLRLDRKQAADAMRFLRSAR